MFHQWHFIQPADSRGSGMFMVHRWRYWVWLSMSVCLYGYQYRNLPNKGDGSARKTKSDYLGRMLRFSAFKHRLRKCHRQQMNRQTDWWEQSNALPPFLLQLYYSPLQILKSCTLHLLWMISTGSNVLPAFFSAYSWHFLCFCLVITLLFSGLVLLLQKQQINCFMTGSWPQTNLL